MLVERVYLDHAATTPVDPEVAEAVARVLRDTPGNPSSIYAEGRAAAEIGRLWAAIERSVKAIRGSASASGAMHKQAA